MGFLDDDDELLPEHLTTLLGAPRPGRERVIYASASARDKRGKAFTRAGLAGAGSEVAPTPPQLLALTGHYASDDPWVGHVRVTARGNRLYVNDGTPLTPLDAKLFRAGDDDWSPERVVFDSFVDGRPMRLIASGAELLRRSV